MTPQVQTPDLTTPRAGLWLTLTQAFLPPADHDTEQAFFSVLSEDLRELCAGAGIDCGSGIAAFEAACAAAADPPALLGHYSALFLAPPPRVCLNLGYYLEGTLHGECQDLVEDMLTRHGVHRRDDFHDLSDHLAVLLELMAWLTAEDGVEVDRRALAHEVLLPALDGLERDIARHEPRSPYRALAQLTRRAVETCTPGISQEPAHPHGEDSDTAADAWHACRMCGNRYAREKDLALLRHALAAHGLPADHLDICPACRNPAVGGGARVAENLSVKAVIGGTQRVRQP